MIVFRVVTQGELLDHVDPEQEEETAFVDAKERLLFSLIKTFGKIPIEKATRVLSPIQTHDYVLDILRIEVNDN